MTYDLIYSKRKTLGLSVKNGKLTVRAPMGLAVEKIEKFLAKHRAWIEKNIEKSLIRSEKSKELSDGEICCLKAEAKKYFLTKTREFAEIMGLRYGRITITSAKTRFGSCSQKGNICFSYRLMLYPEPAREYVIVHELAHLVFMDHSKNFYSLISSYMPDYKERKQLLK